MNSDVLKNCFHKDFRRVIYPLSLGQPAQTKEECIKFTAGIMSFATAFDVGDTTCYSTSSYPAESPLQVTAHSFTDAPGKVIVHVRIPILSGYIQPAHT